MHSAPSVGSRHRVEAAVLTLLLSVLLLGAGAGSAPAAHGYN